MKSIFSYFTIFSINLIIFASMHAAELPTFTPLDQTQSTVAPQRAIALPALDPGDSTTSQILSLSERARRASIQLKNYKLDEPEGDENSKHSPEFAARQRRISHARKLSVWSEENLVTLQSRSLNPIRSISEKDNDLHITITRQQLRLLEYSLASAGVATCFWLHANKSSRRDMPVRGIPTDTVGAGLWVLNGLRGFASSGLTILVTLYGAHKIKGWVDTIYGSDTDRRIDKKLNPIIEDVGKLAAYVDERIEPLATGQQNLCDATEELSAGQENLTKIQQEVSAILVTLAKDYEERHPTDPEALAITTKVDNLQTDTNAATTQILATAQKIERLNNSPQLPVKNPVIQKVPAKSKCCDCSIM